jgi:hypothetical protein
MRECDMKKFATILFLLLYAASIQAKSKPDPADFNLKVHISATQLIPTSNFLYLFADAVLNGKKVKLAGNMPSPHSIHAIRYPFSILGPGDYQIQLKQDESEMDGSVIRQGYELLLPNGDTWKCSISGISE